MKLAFLTTDNREHSRRYDQVVPYFGTAPEALLQGFAGTPGIEVHVISCTQRAMTSPVKLADNIFFHSLLVPKLGWLRTLYSGCIRATRRKLQELGPDLVHGQGTERDCSISTVLSGFPNVLTIHGNMRAMVGMVPPRAKPFYWLAGRLEAFALARTNGVVCITDYTRKAVQPLNRRTWVVPNAVDATFFDIRPEHVPVRMILCVGHVCQRKNQNELMRALDGLAASEPFRLVFAGALTEGDAYGREFQELVAARAWCDYVGVLNRADLKSWLGRAHALILPSVEDNCPMVVLEAMAASVPVAAARVGGIPDLIQHGDTGLLFDPAQSREIGSSVEQLLKNSALGKQLAANARTAALRRFHPQVIASRHIEIYKEILSGLASSGKSGS